MKNKNPSSKKMNLNTPLNAQLELTFACPSLCSHCYNYWRYIEDGTKFKVEKELDLDHFLLLSDKLIEANIFSVVLTGGEPLLRKDILYDIIDRFKSQNVGVSINSSLMLITEDDTEKMKERDVGGVLTSFHSYNEERFDEIANSKGTFKKIVEGIKLFKKNIGPPSVNMVVSQINKKDVYQTGKFLYENFGVNSFSGTPINPCTDANYHLDMVLKPNEILDNLEALVKLEEDFGIFTEVLEPIPYCLVYDHPEFRKFMKKTCTAGKSTLAVSPVGDVRACIHLSENYGSLLENSVEEIWKEMIEWRQTGYYPDECNSCFVIDECKGACRSEAETMYGNITSKPTGMLSVFDSEIELPKHNSSPSSYGNDVNLTVNNLNYREEGDSYILFSPPQRYSFVSKEEFEILTKLSKMQTFKLSNLFHNTSEVGDNINHFLSKMFEAGVIISAEKMKGGG